MVGVLGCSFDAAGGGAGPEVADTESTGVASTSLGDTTAPPGTTSGPGTTNPGTTDPGTTDGTTTDADVTTDATVDTTSDTEDAETTSSSTAADTEDETTTTTGVEPFVLCDADEPELQACYDFADFGAGVLEDLSGQGNHGTVGPMVQAEAGPFGGAARPGLVATPPNHISVPDSASLDVTGPATWEAWVWFDSLPDATRTGVLDNDGQYSMIYSAASGMRCDGGGSQAFAAAIPEGQWVHIACRYDGGDMTIWVDGVLGGSGDGGAMISPNPAAEMSLGNTSPSFNEPLDGLVAAVRVWSEARTDAQIMEAADAAR